MSSTSLESGSPHRFMSRWDVYWVASLVWLTIIVTGMGIFVFTQISN
jgi:hypothetical protein